MCFELVAFWTLSIYCFVHGLCILYARTLFLDVSGCDLFVKSICRTSRCFSTFSW